jgi:murein DD-endopeptidase MepM/ murein hydrolase activator NlpD
MMARRLSVLAVCLIVAAGIASTLSAQSFAKLSAEDRKFYDEEKAKLGSLDVEPMYYLPWNAGEAHGVIQEWFGHYTHSGPKAIYAWDFGFTPQQEVLCARAGVVHEVNEGQGETANYLVVRHEDNTLAAYGHLRDDGFRVKRGDKVNTGDLIGFCGPVEKHLHFVIWTMGNPRKSIPAAFFDHKLNNGIPKQGHNCVSANRKIDEAAIAQAGKLLEQAQSLFDKEKPANALQVLDDAVQMARKGVENPIFPKVLELHEAILDTREGAMKHAEEKVAAGDFDGVEDIYKAVKKQWGGTEWSKKASKAWSDVRRMKEYKEWKKANR